MNDQPDLFSVPILPYAGTSGHGGNGASKERALRDDSTGKTTERQRQTLQVVWGSGARGVTGHELGAILGWNSGQTSGSLSILHKEGLVERLANVRRGRSSVYVMPEFVGSRDVESRGRHADKGPWTCWNCGVDLET